MKYDISPDFGIFRHFASTLNPLVLRFASVFMELLPHGMRSNKDLDISTMFIPTRDSKKIKIRVIKPRNVSNTLPAMVYYPGGGFAFKAAPYHYSNAKTYAKSSNICVILVEYRLSYNTPYNTPLYDAIDAYKYVLDNADTLGIDKDSISIGGDSAGGYLAVRTTMALHEDSLPLPNSQLLVYPVLDSRCETQSMIDYVDTPFWNAKLNKKMWQIYSKGNVIINPVEVDDLSYMPITYIETCEYDCLHDEAIEFYNKILEYSDTHVLYETKRTMHGYDIFSSSDITKAAISSRVDFIAKYAVK